MMFPRAQPGNLEFDVATSEPSAGADSEEVAQASEDVPDELASRLRAETLGPRMSVGWEHIQWALEDEDAFGMVYQPVVALQTGKAVGVEALARFAGPPTHLPKRWFEAAQAAGLAVDLELVAMRKALEALQELPSDVYLSVNVSTATLNDARFHELISGKELGWLVVELTEHAPVQDYDLLARTADALRGLGMRIAIDDVGAGFATLRHILELKPDLIKLDLSLIRDIHVDRSKQALVAGLILFAEQSGAAIIAEGIEKAPENDTLVRLGVAYGQGWFLGEPGSSLTPDPGQGLSLPDRVLAIPTETDPPAHVNAAAAGDAGRLRTEELLARAEALASFGSWQWEIGADTATWSDEVYRLFGLVPGEPPASYENYLQVIHPDDRGRVEERVRQTVERGDPFEFEHRIVRPDGEVRVLHARGDVICNVDGRPRFLYGSMLDVTERALVEERLRERERFLARAQDIARVAAWDLDIATGNMICPPGIEEMSGVPLGTQPLLPALLATVHPDDLDRVRGALEEAATSGESARTTYRIRHARSGEERVLAISTETDRPGHMIGAVADVTDHVRTKALLARAEALASFGSWQWEITAGTVTWSDEMYRLLGLVPGESPASYDAYIRAVHPDDRSRVEERVRQAIERGDPFEFEHRIVRPDGELRVLHVRGQAIGDPRFLYGSALDITERVAAEGVLRTLLAWQATLRRVSTAILHEEELDDFFGFATQEISHVLPVDALMVIRFDGDTGTVVGSVGDHGLDVGGGLPLSADTALRRAHRAGKPARDSDSPAVAAWTASTAGMVLAIPILTGDVPWGALYVAASDAHLLSADVEEHLLQFADIMAFAVVHMEDRERLQLLASTDSLTGVANRRTFSRVLEQLVEEALASRTSLSLVLVDIDHFKRVNDTHGHQVGDDVLKLVAQRLGERARGGDVVARLGGDEFAWIMVGTAQDAASDAARQALEEIEHAQIGPAPQLTVSIGVSGLAESDHADLLFRRADAALYGAKAGGRNQVEVIGEEPVI